MSRRVLVTLVLPGIVLLAAACAQQGQQEAAPPAQGTPAETPMPEAVPMGVPMELTPEKVTEIAQLVVHVAKNPAGAAALLAEHGMTPQQLDDAVNRINADPALKSAFDQAKAAAEAAAASEP